MIEHFVDDHGERLRSMIAKNTDVVRLVERLAEFKLSSTYIALPVNARMLIFNVSRRGVMLERCHDLTTSWLIVDVPVLVSSSTVARRHWPLRVQAAMNVVNSTLVGF